MDELTFPTYSVACLTAKRKAYHGGYNWIVWTGRDGRHRIARQSAASIKAAMLATGTQGTFKHVERRTGHLMLINWQIANIMRRNALAGYI